MEPQASWLTVSSNLTALIGGFAGIAGAVDSVWQARSARDSARETRAAEQRAAVTRVRVAAREIVVIRARLESGIKRLGNLHGSLVGSNYGRSGAMEAIAREIAGFAERKARTTIWYEEAQLLLE